MIMIVDWVPCFDGIHNSKILSVAHMMQGMPPGLLFAFVIRRAIGRVRRRKEALSTEMTEYVAKS
jgi:hypothetical protein